MNNYSALLEKLLSRENLSKDEAESLMLHTMQGELTPAQVAGWLVAMRNKGESAGEIAAAAKIMRQKATGLPGLKHPLVDSCGTGGDGAGLVNVSTLSAMAAATLNIPIAKHGNRSVSSKCGSADLLESLGYNLNEEAETTAKRINDENFGFMFAPAYHPAMKHAIGPRKELGIRTIFNILGPLSNPAGTEIHLLGVYSRQMLEPMAQALKDLGATQALVVHSKDGLDEISPVAETDYVYLDQGQTTTGTLRPPGGLEISSITEIQVADATDALNRSKSVIAGEWQQGIEVVALNTAAIVYLWKKQHSETKQDIQAFIESETSEVIKHLRSGSLKSLVEKWS